MQVIFILSTNYAGSHLLTQLLGAHPACRSIGELHNYRKYQERPDERHSVVNDFAENPWFAGLADKPQADWHRSVLERIREGAPEAKCLVDNSKKVRWASRFVGSRQFTPRFVHLIRDPRALVRRWAHTYEDERSKRRQRLRVIKARPGYLLPALLGSEYDVYCYKWLAANREISEFLARVGQADNVVTYRDLAVNTEQTLRALMPGLGLDFDARQLAFGEVEHRGTLKKEYLEQSRRSEIRLDLRWRNELSAADIERISNNRHIRDYLSGQGLRLLDDGLSRW